MSVEQFFAEDGTLISIPARNSKKIEVMKRIAKEFAVGVVYPEKAVKEDLAEKLAANGFPHASDYVKNN